jgi:predicted  nucleic acid-binding Zn-ribbon protein
MTSASDLYALQELDLRHDTRRALIADIDSRLTETDELVAARERVDEAGSQVESLRRQQRDIEARIEDLDAKVQPLEKKLYDGSVRNPKELTDMQKEVDSLKAQRGRLDEEALRLMEAVEAAAGALEDARKGLEATESAWETDQRDLRAERARAEQENATLEDERGRRTQGMDISALGLYEALRKTKQGRPVARVERGNCQGCRVTLPTHVVQRVRIGSELVRCPRCERILVAG